MSTDSGERSASRWGRIYLGAKVGSLGEVEMVRSQAWTPQDEEEYLDRVRVKAEAKAREILTQAEAEAAVLREKARDEGYSEGMKQAGEEFNELRASMGEASAAVLSAIEGQCSGIFEAWRADLAGLVPLAVEKMLGIVLEEHHRKVLEALYLESVNALSNARQITVFVNPEDEAAVADIIKMSKENHQELESWKVKVDASITPGGLKVESDSSLADNTVESRKAAVNQVLEALHVPVD